MQKTSIILGLTLFSAMGLAGCDSGTDEPDGMSQTEQGDMESAPRDQEGFSDSMEDRQEPRDGSDGAGDDADQGFGGQDEQEGGGF
ncbi:MAG: hypothetical protein ACQERR_07320 [Pseudomonadota bacterium]